MQFFSPSVALFEIIPLPGAFRFSLEGYVKSPRFGLATVPERFIQR